MLFRMKEANCLVGVVDQGANAQRLAALGYEPTGNDGEWELRLKPRKGKCRATTK